MLPDFLHLGVHLLARAEGRRLIGRLPVPEEDRGQDCGQDTCKEQALVHRKPSPKDLENGTHGRIDRIVGDQVRTGLNIVQEGAKILRRVAIGPRHWHGG